MHDTACDVFGVGIVGRPGRFPGDTLFRGPRGDDDNEARRVGWEVFVKMGSTRRLEDRVALVTGASRGAGKGIAAVLGEEGATVYVTGRSVREEGSAEGLPGTIDETAELVDERRGKGVAVRCDHTRDRDVEALFEQIRTEAGGLDVLVNNVWGGYEEYDGADFDAPFWEQPVRHWHGMFTAGVRAHLVASRLAVGLMSDREGGLIVNTTFWDRDRYLGNLFYDVAKAAVNRMAAGMARELRGQGIAALALAPGFMRTERVMAAHARKPFDLEQTESPEYIGRAVAALASDSEVMRRSGGTFRVGSLAEEYGFTDIDGRRVPPFDIPEDA